MPLDGRMRPKTPMLILSDFVLVEGVYVWISIPCGIMISAGFLRYELAAVQVVMMASILLINQRVNDE